MYIKFLEYLLEDDPNVSISKSGIKLRKKISPLVRMLIPLTIPVKLKVLRRANLPNRPMIFAATHGFKEDVECTLLTINCHSYLLIGALAQVFHSFQGISAWVNGSIFVNRADKVSRQAAKEKMICAINLGANIVIFPEGTWNKSPNKLVGGLFPGVYDVAMATGALVAPVATHREGKIVYSILDECFDITEYSRKEGVHVLRDKLATLQWELMEKCQSACRKDMPSADQVDEYWENYINALMAEVKFYEYDLELHTKYVDKSVVERREAFSYLSNLKPSRNNAFLFDKRNYI